MPNNDDFLSDLARELDCSRDVAKRISIAGAIVEVVVVLWVMRMLWILCQALIAQ